MLSSVKLGAAALGVSVALACGAQADCKSELVDAISKASTHGPYEVTESFSTESTFELGQPPKRVVDKSTAIQIVPPDRAYTRLMERGKAERESVLIGKEYWTRDVGKSWSRKTASGQSGSAEDDLAKQIEREAARLRASVQDVACQPEVARDGRKIKRFTYSIVTMGLASESSLLVDAATNRPIRAQHITELKDLVSKTTQTVTYRYDPTIKIDAPK